MKKTINVLVVEDEYLVAADIEESLIALGYSVQKTVASGQAAIDEVKRNLPDIILMDIVLKGEMSGIEAATIIQQEHDVPIIYLTANADFSTVEKAKVSLPYGYILKPFTDKELQTNIEISRFKFENDIKYKIENEQFNKIIKINSSDLNEIIIDTENGFEKIVITDVYFIEQTNHQCLIHSLNNTVAVKKHISEIELKFPKNNFIRVSDCHIINKDKIFLIKFPDIIIADLMSVITIEDSYKNLFEETIK